jgi:hypothetical protein
MIVEKFPNLQHLDVSHFISDFLRINRADVDNLVSDLNMFLDMHVKVPLILSSVTQLDLSRCPDLTNEKLRKIVKKFPNLQTLDLKSCQKITADGIKCVTSLPHLENLNLEWTSMNDKVVQVIVSALPKLKRLYLQASGISPEGAKCLGSLSNLVSVSLDECSVSSEVLTILQTLPNLVEADLSIWKGG